MIVTKERVTTARRENDDKVCDDRMSDDREWVITEWMMTGKDDRE